MKNFIHEVLGTIRVNTSRPSAEQLKQALNVALWASIGREEGRSPRVALTLFPEPASTVGDPWLLRLKSPLALNPANVVKLFPATEARLTSLHVEPVGDMLQILGIRFILDDEPHVRVIVEGTGIITIKEGTTFDSARARIEEGRAILLSRDAYEKHFANSSLERRLDKILWLARSRGHGGTIAVVTSDIPPDIKFNYELSPIFSAMSHHETILPSQQNLWRATLEWQKSHEYLEHLIRGASALTGVDRALVLNAKGDVVGFGGKLLGGNPKGLKVVTPEASASSKDVDPVGYFTGTRHQSAVDYVSKYSDARVFVISHDGKVSVMMGEGNGNVLCMEHLEWLY